MSQASPRSAVQHSSSVPAVVCRCGGMPLVAMFGGVAMSALVTLGCKQGSASSRDAMPDEGEPAGASGFLDAIVQPAGASGFLDAIVPASRTIDWSRAGVVQPDGTKGIPVRTAVCATIDAATYGVGTVDASGAIQAAIDSCPANGVVFLPAGTYLLQNAVNVHRSVVLRGAGPKVTKLVENASIVFEPSVLPSASVTTVVDWTAGYDKGATVVKLADTSKLAVGQNLVLDQLNDTDVKTPGYIPLVNPRGNNGLTVGVGGNNCASRSGNSFCTDGQTAVPRALMQIVQVVAIQGSDVTIDSPLTYTHTASLSPQALFWAGGDLTYAGIEDLSIDAQFHDRAIAFTYCTNCWVRRVEVDNIARAAVALWYDYHFEMRESYLYRSRSQSPENYGVEVDDTAASLFENNIFDSLAIGIILGWSSSGNVVSYNYTTPNPAPGSQMLAASHGTHCVHTFMNLYEGNVGAKLAFDNTWGSTSHQTLFRNRLSGYLEPQLSGTQRWSNGNWPIMIEASNRFFNVVGNVIGRPEVQNGYQAASVASADVVAATARTSTCQCCTCGLGVAPNYVLGFWNTWAANSDTEKFDAHVAGTLLRWGNFDFFSGTTHFDSAEIPTGVAVPTTHTLPASAYLGARPSWFGSVAWPPIGPDVTGGSGEAMAHKIPAQLCYEGGSAQGKGFDPAGCY